MFFGIGVPAFAAESGSGIVRKQVDITQVGLAHNGSIFPAFNVQLLRNFSSTSSRAFEMSLARLVRLPELRRKSVDTSTSPPPPTSKQTDHLRMFQSGWLLRPLQWKFVSTGSGAAKQPGW
jgi:hypothetical protein